MAYQPMTESQRLFSSFLFGFIGSLIANFLVRQIQAPSPPVADTELPPSQSASALEDE